MSNLAILAEGCTVEIVVFHGVKHKENLFITQEKG